MSDRSLDVDRARVLLHEAAIRYEGAAQIFPGDRDALLSDAAFCRTFVSQLAALPDAAELQRDNAKWAQDFAAFAALNRSEKEAYERTVASLESQLEEARRELAHEREIEPADYWMNQCAELTVRLSTVERERANFEAVWHDAEDELARERSGVDSLLAELRAAESTAREAAARMQWIDDNEDRWPGLRREIDPDMNAVGFITFSEFVDELMRIAALRPSETSSENQK